jgi:hypothetical protein
LNTYIVTFDVSSNYDASLKEAMKSYGFYCPINSSCWAIRTEQSAVQIRDKLNSVAAASDKIFVIRSGTEAAWTNSYGPKNDEWLREHL